MRRSLPYRFAGNRRDWQVTLVALWLLLGMLLGAGNATADNHIQGPAFSDHHHRENMPKAWQDKSIRYDKLSADIDLAITLDQHLYPALLPLIKQYATQHRLKVAVEEGTCGISAGALLDKKVDVAGFCCPAGETDRLPGLRYHTLGIASLALLVHPQNPVSDVTLEQAQGLYMGKIGNWRMLDAGFDQPVLAVARLHCKNRPGHWRLLLDNADFFSPVVREVSTIPDMLQVTAERNNTLGYETLWMARLNAEGKVKALKINGASPADDDALLAGRYPLYRTYNITTWSEPKLRKPHAQELVTYLYEHFDEVEKKYGLISSQRLRQAGWQFAGDELIAAPHKPGSKER